MTGAAALLGWQRSGGRQSVVWRSGVRRTGRLLTGLLVGGGLLVGCSGDPSTVAVPPTAGSPSAPGSAPATGERVRATLGGVELVLEVADTAAERAVGLMRRTSVTAGTGMVFRYDALSEGRFYMFQVPIPLTAVFIREGRVVSSVVMPPCAATAPQDCPTYGADGPFDTVVETDPATLPDVQPGDAYVLTD